MSDSISNINSQISVDFLKNQPENQYFERKGKDTKASKLADELIGMLNADGGVLAFGVSDNGDIQDLKELGDKLNDYRKVIFDYISPACDIELEEIIIDDKLIFLFHIEQDLERIFYRKDTEKYFLRVADSNRELNQDGIKKLEYDKNIRAFEDEEVVNFDIEDLDKNLLQFYKEKIQYQGDIFDLLHKKYLVNKKDGQYIFKKSCILLFAIDPERYIPSASVRYIRYQGIDNKTGVEHNVVKDQRFENNIPRLIDELRSFLRISFKDYYFLDIEIGRFKKVPEYPEEAWLEAVVNALCHRSYNLQGNAIYIKHYDNRLEISNSGPLPAQVTIENIATERYARNPRVARVLEDMGYVRQLNEGVARIYEYMEKSMLAKPIYEERNSNIYLTLENNIGLHKKTIHTDLMKHIENDWQNYNQTQKQILLHIFSFGGATVGDLAEILNISPTTIRRYLTNLVKAQILDRLSEKDRDINAQYVIKKL